MTTNISIQNLQALQTLNSRLQSIIELNTIILVDGIANTNDALHHLVGLQCDVEQQLIDNVALFQVVEYRPRYNGIDADFSQ